VQGIIDELMATKVINLLEQKRPAEANKTSDSKYFPCHKIISHLIKDCYVFKDIIERMIGGENLR